MSKKAFIVGVLWIAALAVSFYWGQSQSSEPSPSVSSPEKKLPTPSVSHYKNEGPAFIKANLQYRDDIFVHDELWLAASDWASREPEEATDSLHLLKFDDIRNPYLFAALSQWASQDPQKALAWLTNILPEIVGSEHYLNAALIRGMARKNADDALAFLLDQPLSSQRSTIDFILGAWAQDGASHLIENINKLPENLKLHALQKAAAHLSPEMLNAARGLAKTLADPQERSTWQSSIAERWAAREPKTALQWAEEHTNPEVIGVVAKHWARQEPLKASTWLDTQRGSPIYDLSARAVAWSVVGLDPNQAFSQVEAMQSEGLRLETFEQLGRFWISDQPVQARAFLEQENPLPVELRDALLSHFK